MNGRPGRWRTVVAAASLLTLGAAAGITADRLLHRRADAVASRLARVHRDPLAAVDRAVGLRPEQRARVAAILESRQPAIDRVWRDTHVRLRATVDSVVSEIAAVLDSGQAERFRAAARELHGEPRRMHAP
ncbi:MAG: hypothetical protein ACREON_10675 [Gemmatimonadaceae bacterium]